MKKFLKAVKIFLVIGFVVCGFSYQHKQITLAVEDDYGFAENEDYYYDLCSGSGLSDEDKKACKAFRNYLTEKQKNLDAEMKDLSDNIKDIKANIKNEGQKIERYNAQIAALDVQINSIVKSIAKIEDNIVVLNGQINDREIKIAELDKQIKANMVVSQANFRTNGFIKFIMGASSFVDLIRRITAINTIVNFCKTKIDKMEKEKQLLQNDLDELQVQKDTLIEQQNDLEVKQKSLEKLKQMTQELIDEYHLHEAELIREWDNMKEDYSELDKVIGDIDKALESFTPSKEFGQFVKNKRIHITSGCYYYHVTSGGFHAAIDVGNLGLSTPVYAVANGYVYATGSGCPVNGGYLGNNCNGGKGNYVFMVTEIDGKYYTVYYEHLSEVKVKVGDLVYKEQTVMGISGNSGNSSGAHLHFAIYYLGTTSETSIKEIANLYRRKGIRFGLTYNITGSCAYRNNKAPCFLNPMEIYGFYYPNWYYVN